MAWPANRPHPLFGEAHHALAHIDRTHRPVHVRPAGDPSLAFVMFVPTGWQAALSLPAPEDGGPDDVIGLFAADASETSPTIVVRASRPMWEVDPLEWVRASLVLAGWRIAIARWLDQPEGRFEICAVKSDARGLQVRRTVGFLDGGRILRVDTIAGAPRWREIHDLQWPCGLLLELDAPTEQARVEGWRELDGPLVRFSLPSSWSVAGIPRGDPRCVRWIADIGDGAERDAGVRIDATDLRGVMGRLGPDLEPRQVMLREDLRAHGIALSERLERLSEADDPGARLHGWRGAYAVDGTDAHGQRYDVRLAHRDLGETRVDYVMLAPPRSTCGLDWLRAVRAFSIAVGTTVPAPRGPRPPPR